MTKVTRLTLEEGGILERRRLHLREVADDADAPLDTVGADLRAARKKKGLELAQVSQILKIRPDQLQALEEGDVATLPGRAYAIGFLRSYAEFLGLDPAGCVERFKAEIAGRGEPDEAASTFQLEAEPRKLPQGWIVLVVLVLIGVIWGGYYLSVSANRMLAQNVTPPPVQQATVQPRPAPPVQPAAAPGTAPVQTATAPQPPAVTPQASAGSEAEPAVLPSGQQYGLMNKDHSRITLRVHQLTRVLVQGPSGTVYINRPLNPGDTYMAPNVVGMIVTTGDAGAVEVILDGQSVGRLGKQGAANGVSLNPQDLMDRVNHHG